MVKTFFFHLKYFSVFDWLHSPSLIFQNQLGVALTKFERFTMLNVWKLLDDWRHAKIVARWLSCFWRLRKISHAVRTRKSQIIARVHKKATLKMLSYPKNATGRVLFAESDHPLRNSYSASFNNCSMFNILTDWTSEWPEWGVASWVTQCKRRDC